jgi:hypothetical protein
LAALLLTISSAAPVSRMETPQTQGTVLVWLAHETAERSCVDVLVDESRCAVFSASASARSAYRSHPISRDSDFDLFQRPPPRHV